MSRYLPVDDLVKILTKLHELSDRLAAQDVENKKEHAELKAGYERKLAEQSESFRRELNALKALLLSVQSEISSNRQFDFDRSRKAREFIKPRMEDE